MTAALHYYVCVFSQLATEIRQLDPVDGSVKVEWTAIGVDKGQIYISPQNVVIADGYV